MLEATRSSNRSGGAKVARDNFEVHRANGRRQATFHPGVRGPRRQARVPAARHSGKPAGPHPRSAVLHRLGVRLISFDRPGYGESDRLAGLRVADAAADVLTIADALGLEKFSVVGRSGGGPHALACAALLPERTTKAAVLVGLAPHGAEGLDWFDGMAQSNVTEYTAAANGYEDIVAHTKAMASAVRANPASLIARLQAELPDPDRRVVADRGIRSMLIETYAEALRTSDHGWIDDVLAVCSPWGFDPATVRVPVLLGTAPVTCSPRPATPGGWPTGSPARPWWSRPGRPTSAHSMCSRTFCAGCRQTGPVTGRWRSKREPGQPPGPRFAAVPDHG